MKSIVIMLITASMLLLSSAVGLASPFVPQITKAYHQDVASPEFVKVKAKRKRTKKRRGGGGCQTLSSSTLNKKAQRYSKAINSASRQYGVNSALIKSVITIESCFRSKARGSSGEKGLMQLMPGTARRFNIRNGFNSWQNIHGGTKYLSFLLRRYNGNVQRAVAAYNGGEGNVDRSGGIPARNRGYVRKVMQAYRKFSGRSISQHKIPKASKKTTPKPLKKKTVKKKQSIHKNVVKKKTIPSRQKVAKQLKHSYVVKMGDTVYEVMRQTRTPVKTIIRQNGLKKPYRLRPGQILSVANPSVKHKVQVKKQVAGKAASLLSGTYVVKPGDTLYSISRKSGVPVKNLIRTNRLMIPYELNIGQHLRLK
jgi:LysM repeat protein